MVQNNLDRVIFLFFKIQKDLCFLLDLVHLLLQEPQN